MVTKKAPRGRGIYLVLSFVTVWAERPPEALSGSSGEV